MYGTLVGRRSLSRQERWDLRKGIMFISPWVVGFLAFQVLPLFSSLYYSLTYYDLLRPAYFVGAQNYTNLFQDRNFTNALYNTLFYVVFAVPGSVVVAFCLAVVLNQQLPLRSVVRAIFFVPSIVPQFVAAMVWIWIYNQQYGLLNGFLASLGMRGVHWLSSPTWSKPSLIIMSLWACGTTMVIYLGALQDVPREMYEAAHLDGAGPFQALWRITLPMVTPAVLFNLLIGLIDSFQYFTPAWIMTGGGPVRSTEFYGLYLYNNAFQYFKMGYASAMAWILFFITVGAAIVIFRSSARWVYYGGERL